MKKNLLKSFVIVTLLMFVSLVYFVGCSDEATPSLYNPPSTTGVPEITAVDPPAVAIGAVTAITITGKNFSSDISKVKVYFGKEAANILSASPTQLTVISPNVSGDMIIRVANQSSVEFSNSYQYTLTPAAEDFYPVASDSVNRPYSFVFDKSDNIYSYNTSLGVYQITPDGTGTLYSPKSGEAFWTSMRLGKDGILYGVRGLQAIFFIPANAGGTVKNSAWVSLTPSSTKISKIEFDPLGNLWAAGKNAAIFRIKADKSYVSFPFDYNVTAMRVFVENSTTYLYVAAQQGTSTTIKRLPIDANGDLGTPENYFDFSTNYGTEFTINDMTFAADGTLYLATDLPSPIVYINTDKSHGLLYEGILLKSPALSIAWGNGNYLFYVRTRMNETSGKFKLAQAIVKMNMLKPGAPYYGM
jgi:hypothetical protein